MKIFSAQQIRSADEFTIKNNPISSWKLMENAARACFLWFKQMQFKKQDVVLFCGKGNNGGDGLALARLLDEAAYTVRVYIANHTKNQSEDFSKNLALLKKTTVAITEINSISEITLPANAIVFDAVLGTGLQRPLSGFLAELIGYLNQQNGIKISIDIPTGLFADNNKVNNMERVFKADHTLSFQFPKLAFLFPESGACAGEFHVLPIGLSETYINQTETSNYFIDADLVRELLPRKQKWSYKNKNGHAAIVAGSLGKIGAAILATHATLKSGAGLCTALVPKCGIIPIQTANPEVMVHPISAEAYIDNIPLDTRFSALGFGPGLGTHQKTKNALLRFLQKCTNPVVLDADALNCISEESAWSILPKNTILTPHLGEFARMVGEKITAANMFEEGKKFAKQHNVILVLKGAHTAIYTAEGNVFFNSSGTPAMATAGSGDVLLGIITGLLAQGFAPVYAAICGVYFHGKSGEKAEQKFGFRGVVATDLIKHLKIA